MLLEIAANEEFTIKKLQTEEYINTGQTQSYQILDTFICMEKEKQRDDYNICCKWDLNHKR